MNNTPRIRLTKYIAKIQYTLKIFMKIDAF